MRVTTRPRARARGRGRWVDRWSRPLGGEAGGGAAGRDTWTLREPGLLTDDLVASMLALSVLVTVVYRCFLTIANLLPFALAHPDVRTRLLIVTALYALYHVLPLLAVWRFRVRGHRRAVLAFVVDAAVMVGFLAAIQDAAGVQASHGLLGNSLVGGTVAMWTSALGPWLGAAAAVAGIVVSWQAGWCADSGLLACILVFGYYYVGITLGLWITRRALGDGVRESGELGGRLERHRAQRMIHDTAVQTLEAIALTASVRDARQAEAALARIAAMASSEVASLRTALEDRAGDAARPDLLLAVHAALGEPILEGLEVDLEVQHLPAHPVTDEGGEALVGAVREALVNVVKHARTSQVSLRLRPYGGGVQATIVDQGIGFEPDVVRTGFGWRESIRGRVNAVSGSVVVSSAPGRGTTVRIWVPGRPQVAPLRFPRVPASPARDTPVRPRRTVREQPERPSAH